MNGAALLTATKRRLAENGVNVGDERTAELFDHITHARDIVKGELVDVAPHVIGEWVTLELDDPSDERLYKLPDAKGDPVRIVELRDKSCKIPFDKTVNLDNDLGDYQPEGTRKWRFSQDTDLTNGVEVLGGFHSLPIDANTAESDIGLPTPAHRAIALAAAYLSLTVDEESGGEIHDSLFQKEIGTLKDRYGEQEQSSGEALRHTLMKSIGEEYGDTLY